MISWIFLIVGGIFEVVFVTMMKLSNGFTNRKYTLLSALAVGISLYTLSLALKELSVGVGYAIWAGIGAIGTVLVGIIFFNESKNWKKILFVLFILIGIVGLKLSS